MTSKYDLKHQECGQTKDLIPNFNKVDKVLWRIDMDIYGYMGYMGLPPLPKG